MNSKCALVTGGSGGIGMAIARRLLKAGYGVTISGRQEEKLLAAADTFAGEGLNAIEPVSADVRNEDDIVRLIAAHESRWGRLDCLVNNAGIGIGQPIGEIQARHFDLQVSINLRALMITTRESVGLLKRAGGEHGKALIVNMASITGKREVAGLAAYSATKSAVVSFSASSQLEFSEFGVGVTAICPGYVATEMSEYVQDQIPPDEMISPEDIAEAVHFLLVVSPNCVIPELIMTRPGANAESGWA